MPPLPQNIFTLLGLDGLPENRKAQLLERMTTLVQKRLALRLIDSLSQEDGRKFEELLQTHRMDDPEVANFFQTRLPDINTLLQEEIAGVKKELLNSVAAPATA